MEQLEVQNMAIFLGQHADKVLALMQVGFFDMRNGSMTVYFGNEGTIKKIERHNILDFS